MRARGILFPMCFPTRFAGSTVSSMSLEDLASRRGLEPLTPGLGNLCSIQLSYRDSDQPCGGQNPYGQGKPKRGMPLA